MRFIGWCNTWIKIGFYLIFGLVPLLLTPWNYELFEYNKMIAVYAITAIITSAWLIKMAKEQEVRIARTPLDIPILLFTASQLISTIFSIDPHVSWLGYYSRFNGGMWSVLSYVLLYYAFVSNSELFSKPNTLSDTKTTDAKLSKSKQKTKQILLPHVDISALLYTALATGVLVAFYGILERLGIDKHLWVQDVQNRVFSTLGQPNWLAAYLIALFPITLAVMYTSLSAPAKNWLRTIIVSFISLLFFVALLFTRSRSGLFGFAIAGILFWALVITSSPGVKKFRDVALLPFIKPFTALHVAFALIIFINGTGSAAIDRFVTFGGWKNALSNQAAQTNKKTAEATPSAVAGPALEVGGTESGVIRKYVWQAAVNAWTSSLKTQLIGTGTETFAFAFYEFRPIAHNQTSEWDFLYNKAHNEYLNYLATTGIFGLGSYLLLLGSFIWWFVKKTYSAKNNAVEDHDNLPVTRYALFAGWVSILITNFFGFSVVILQVFLFLFPALIFASGPDRANVFAKSIRLPGWIPWVLMLGGIMMLTRVGSYWYADTLYAQGYRLVRSGLFGQAIPAFAGAIRLNSSEPTYHDELGSAYATLAVAAFEGSNATQAAQLATLAIDESIKAIQTSPRNVNFYKTRTKIYYTLSSLEPTFNAKAVESLQHALTLSSNDPKIYYNLAILVGREGETDKAIEYLQKAKTLKPNYRDAYYALWVFFTEGKKQNDARAILLEYITKIDPNDKDFLERIK